MNRSLRTACVFILGLCLGGCAASRMPAVGTPGYALEEDEREILRESESEQRRIDTSGLIDSDTLASAYVNGVLDRLTPRAIRDHGMRPKVVILRNPLLNAFAYPTGRIYIHTGLLSRLESESELAMLLGHELSHAIHRHALRQARTTRHTADALAIFGVAMLPFGLYGSLAGLLGSIGSVAAVTGYSRELEAEADNAGLALMAQAGYDVADAERLFRHLKEELDEWHEEEPFFWGTHPRLTERIENVRRYREDPSAPSAVMTNAAVLDSVFFPLLLTNAGLDETMGRFRSAARALDRVLARDSGCAKAFALRGDIERQQVSDPQHLTRARVSYESALSRDSTLAKVYRGLGLVLLKLHERALAADAFRHYLTLAPTAPDRKHIEQQLHDLDDQKDHSP